MPLDRTQHQSTHELDEAKKLSLEPTRPPSTIPGYRIIRFLGSGAYGEVWSADDLKTGRKVAIKFYTRGSTADISLLASEVEKLALLGADRYVVQLLNVGWDANPPYYVMDYLDQGSLEERISNRQTLEVVQALELFQELATGMMHMHNKGILHCDLKPGNVMLDHEGKPRIADFGQSRLSTGDSPALGTLFYMAPEQADLNAVPDARWDVYALGAIFFSMLTGKPPYYCAELANQIEKSNDIDGRLLRYRDALMTAPRPREHRSIAGVDRALADIIDNCIAAHPSKRFENVTNILVALRQREIVRARRPLMMLGLIGPLLLILLMSIFGWLAFRESVTQTRQEITKKAHEGNRFAAKLAARSASEQIHDYFRVVTQLSRDSDFRAALDEFLSDDQLEQWRLVIADPNLNSVDYEDPNAPGAFVVGAREALRDHPLRLKLQPFLEERLTNRTGEFPVASSWFVSDRYGNQIASAFRSATPTLGKNYSFRTYFTGLPNDLPVSKIEMVDATLPAAERKAQFERRTIIQKPHISAAFLSEQSNSWKLAFSTPVMDGEDVIAIVAVTVDLGNFIDFENEQSHYAMLVDNREGDNRGIILEHPLFQILLAVQPKLPDDLSRSIVQLDQIPEDNGHEIRFRDPVGQHPLGIVYDRESIVGRSEVMMLKSLDAWMQQEPDAQARDDESGEGRVIPLRRDGMRAPRRDDSGRTSSGLVVLALEDYASVVAPANNLIYEWGRLASFAAFFLLAVSVGMWFFVRRLLQESREKLERAFSPSRTESISFRNRDTVPNLQSDSLREKR
jgi:eukaryotic-like serine/threonine-protein kinase